MNIEELKKELENKPPLSVGLFWRAKDNIENIFIGIKFAYQRVVWGYDERWLFSFDSQFAELMLKVLPVYADQDKMMSDIDYVNKNRPDSQRKLVEDSIDAFKSLDKAINSYKYDEDIDLIKEDKNFKKKIKSFVKAIPMLWD